MMSLKDRVAGSDSRSRSNDGSSLFDIEISTTTTKISVARRPHYEILVQGKLVLTFPASACA